MWKLIVKALSGTIESSEKEDRIVTCLRAVIVLLYILTNCFIIAGVIRHWYD